jgi:hypothetical protein
MDAGGFQFDDGGKEEEGAVKRGAATHGLEHVTFIEFRKQQPDAEVIKQGVDRLHRSVIV